MYLTYISAFESYYPYLCKQSREMTRMGHQVVSCRVVRLSGDGVVALLSLHARPVPVEADGETSSESTRGRTQPRSDVAVPTSG